MNFMKLLKTKFVKMSESEAMSDCSLYEHSLNLCIVYLFALVLVIVYVVRKRSRSRSPTYERVHVLRKFRQQDNGGGLRTPSMSRAPLLFDTLIEQQRLHEEEMSATRGPMFERDNGIGRGEFNFAKLRNRSGSPHPAHPEFEQLQLMQQFHKLSLNDPGLPDEQPAAPQPQGVVPQLRAAEFGLPNVWMWRGSEQPKEEPASFAEQPEEPLALPAELHTSAILNLRDLPIALCRQNQPPFQYYIGIPLSAFKNPQPIVHLGRLQQPWSPPQPRRSGRQRRPVVRYGYEIY